MNEINFNVEDIEQVDLSIGMGIKEIYPPIEDLEVTPTKEQQVFNHENSYGYDEVIVEPIPDEYIIPDGTLPITENATYDVRSYARVSASVYPAPNLQDKEITINENGTHDITYDEGYDGLNQVSVTVDAIENLEEELETYNIEITEQETTINDIVETLKTKAIGGGDEMEIYSFEEVKTNKVWVNGKPLYRKVIFIPEIGNAGNHDVPYNIPDAELVWVDETAAFALASYETIPASSHYGGDLWIRAWVSLNNKYVRLRTPVNLSGYSAYITILYTKTTD